MVLETYHAVEFADWFREAAPFWLRVIGGLLVLVVVVGWLVSMLRHGPAAGAAAAGKMFVAAVEDLLLMSPRRVAALTWLTVKESVRRRIVIVFAVFLLLVAFAGWFLDPGSTEPARLYLSFVLTATSYLVLLLALFLSSLSLPADIKNRTIHTIVTKPVRASEIVVGRILGFTVVGTGLLALMGAVSYVFVVRGLTHTHTLTEASLEQVEKSWQQPAGQSQSLPPLTLQTAKAQDHHHTAYIDPSAEETGNDGVRRGIVRTDVAHGHWHDVSFEIGPEGPPRFSVTGPIGNLAARVPIYGRLIYKDRAGRDSQKGINVGDEWTYRGYVEGGTLAAAVWTFENLRREDFPHGLQVEMTLGVFRTHKGEIKKGVPGSLSVRNPATGDEVEVRIFASKEFVTDVQIIPLELRAPDGRLIDLFNDMVSDGKLEIWLRCVAPHQYFGAGQADLYLRARDASFAANFAKGYLGIWVQMVLVTGFGVMFSTFLSGPIAMLATAGTLVGGLFSRFIDQLAAHKVWGGGPVEAMIRLVTQQNVVSELPESAQATVAQMLDTVAEWWLRTIWYVLPDFRSISFADHVAYGFDVSGGLVLKALFQMAAFLVPLVILGYLFLKSREVAQ